MPYEVREGLHTVRGAHKIKCFDTDGVQVSFRGRFGREYRYYDGFGPIWLYTDASGMLAFVRAETWESALELVEDEILSPIEDEVELAELKLYAAGHDGELPGDYVYQSNAKGSGIVSHDVNGWILEILSEELLVRHDITMIVEL